MRNLKKFLAALSVAVLATSSLAETTLADVPTSIDSVEAGEVIAEDTLESGTYAVDLTWVPTMDSMLDPIVEIDAANKTFKIYNATKPETDKGSGKITFDSATGEYTLTYEAGVKEENVGKTTVATYDAEKDTLTFKSALLYGTSSFNNTDESGNFVSYTAVVTTLSSEEDTTTVADTLESGTYAVDLTWVPTMDSMLDPIVEIDAANKTFKIYNATKPETDKGSGKITFDSATGEYTLTYETGVKEENVGKTTVATYDAEKDTLTFKSALLYGTSSFNNTDESGNFVSYTAVVTTLSNEVVYDAVSNAVLTKEQMQGLVAENATKNVVIKANNDITITFAKGTMKEVEGVEKYDFTTAVVSDYVSAQVPSSVTKDDFVAKISYSYSGNLPAEASIKIVVGKDYAGKDLYYSLLKDGALSETQKVTVDADGYMTVKQSHCSDYVITTTDPSANTNTTTNTTNTTTTTDTNTTTNTTNTTTTTDTNTTSPDTGDQFSFATLSVLSIAGIVMVMMGKKYGKEL